MADIVVPKLRLAVLCQHVEFDSEQRPFSLQEPLHTVLPEAGKSFPFEPAPMFLYAQLEDAVGTFPFRVVTRDEEGVEGNKTNTATRVFDGTSNRLIPIESVFELKGFRFPKPGIYMFHLICNQASLSDPRNAEPHPFPAPRL